jgi:hypothetical protein
MVVAMQCLAGQMEEEAKLEFTITVNWRREDGSIVTTQLGTLDRGACRSAEDVGLQLAHAKSILGRLQEIVVREQLQRYCEAVRPCPRCHRRRHLKDYRCASIRSQFARLLLPLTSTGFYPDGIPQAKPWKIAENRTPKMGFKSPRAEMPTLKWLFLSNLCS